MSKLSEKQKELFDVIMNETIYAATVSVIREHGVSGMTMDCVAATANPAKGNLYNYFRDKLKK